MLSKNPLRGRKALETKSWSHITILNINLKPYDRGIYYPNRLISKKYLRIILLDIHVDFLRIYKDDVRPLNGKRKDWECNKRRGSLTPSKLGTEGRLSILLWLRAGGEETAGEAGIFLPVDKGIFLYFSLICLKVLFGEAKVRFGVSFTCGVASFSLIY